MNLQGPVRWEPDRAAAVLNLCTVAMPDEQLGTQHVHRLWSGQSAVLGQPDGAGVIAVMVRGSEGARSGHVRLIAVAPQARRRGVGRSLLRAGLTWLADQGAVTATFGADLPYYLWPGIDTANLPALALAQDGGFALGGLAMNLLLDTGLTRPTPPGVVVQRLAPTRPTAVAVRALIAAHWPPWLTEWELGLAGGTALAAFQGERAVGFVNHSNLRPGWIGPLGTAPAARCQGVGAALMAAACADLHARGQERAEIAWVGPLGFMADLGARPGRVFARCTRPLTP